MSTYVARNAGDVRCGDLMIFDSDAGEEFVNKIVGPARMTPFDAEMVRICGISGREVTLFVTDGVVLAVDEPVYEEDRARDAYFANRSQGK